MTELGELGELDELHEALAGRYEIVRELGRGGMAVVYLARDVKHERQVAIKVLPSELATTIGAERFLREIRTVAQLSHPNILPLHDSIAVDRVRCFVMPYVDGESLRQRLARERQLGIEQAVDIARQVAAGLDYAHAHGVVHRDVKPENILLVGDQAVIADFGLARVVFTASSSPVTGTGIAVGTPAYMSPEQAAADQAIDSRTDVYSLGCTFFEMVAGMPPFRGATAGALLAAHATRTPPSLCSERDTCPPGMDAAVQRALAKVPADRFRTAGEFVRALETWRASASSAAPVASRRTWLVWGAAVAVVGGLAIATPTVVERVRLAGAPLDSNAVVVLPFSGAGGRQLTAPLARQRLTSAFSEWRDLRVVDLVDQESARAPTVTDGRRMARRNGAGLFVLATVGALGDSVELRATLHGADGAPLRHHSLRVPDQASGSAERYRAMTATLLRGADPEPGDEGSDANPGTSRAGSWRAFTKGQRARAAWELAEAERAYRHAVELDPTFARAHLWRAQVAAWLRPGQGREWGDGVSRALARPGQLSPRDSLLGAGLAALAAGRYPEACAAYRTLRELQPQSDLAWYGLGYCLGLDPVVVASAASPSGWRFRGDPMMAVSAFDSALAHAEGAPSFAFEMLGMLLIAEPLRTRLGRTLAPDVRRFLAMPFVVRDTVAMIPYLADAVDRGSKDALATRNAALQRNVRRLEAAYRDWARRAPASSEAWAALSYVHELQGQPAALAALDSASARTPDPARMLGMNVHRVRLLVKHGALTRARTLADSLLRHSPSTDGQQAITLAGIAALIGDVSRAATLLAQGARTRQEEVFPTAIPVPPAALRDATEYLAVASLGACSDGLREYRSRIERTLTQYATGEQRTELHRTLLERPGSMSVPCLGPQAVVGFIKGGRLVRMQQAMARGDVRGVRMALDSVRNARLGLRPGDVAMDHTYHEAWLLLSLGDTAAAVRHLELPLSSLPILNTHLLDDVPAAAALGRALALRADLAAATGDVPSARRYAAQVVTLWGSASPPLQPLVRRMRMIADGTSPATLAPRPLPTGGAVSPTELP